MKQSDFTGLLDFSYNEKSVFGEHIWHNDLTLAGTDFRSMRLLQDLRFAVDKPIVLHVAYHPTGHSSNSMHYQKVGTAIDFHFKSDDFIGDIKKVLSFLENRGLANECGLGIYPDWKPAPGFHIDRRGLVGRPAAKWGAIRNDKGKQDYFDFDTVLMYAHGGGLR